MLSQASKARNTGPSAYLNLPTPACLPGPMNCRLGCTRSKSTSNARLLVACLYTLSMQAFNHTNSNPQPNPINPLRPINRRQPNTLCPTKQTARPVSFSCPKVRSRHACPELRNYWSREETACSRMQPLSGFRGLSKLCNNDLSHKPEIQNSSELLVSKP